MAFPPHEIAELNVGGQHLHDWETVMVRRDFTAYPSYFVFTCSESKGAMQAALRIKPGDDCTIMLGGQLALTGYVNARQVSYDAHRHGVMIQGRGSAQDVSDSSLPLEVIKGGEFRDKTFQEIGNEVLKPFGKTLEVQGGQAGDKFKVVRIQPGEGAHNLIERLARIGGFWIGEDVEGKALIAIAEPKGGGGTLEEGKNILECRATILDTYKTHPVIGLAQNIGDDEKWGPDASEITVQKDGGATRYRPLVVVGERPMTLNDMKNRIDMETKWRSTTLIDALIVVYGWLENGGTSGSLWREGTLAMVNSGMAMLNQSLWIKSVTFTQDNESGTRTQLELINRPTSQISFG